VAPPSAAVPVFSGDEKTEREERERTEKRERKKL
jgi:hypothetical protein